MYLVCLSFVLVNLSTLQIDTLKLTSLILLSEVSARDVVNPPKSYEEVFKEGGEGHDLYVISHNDYYAGECLWLWTLRL